MPLLTKVMLLEKDLSVCLWSHQMLRLNWLIREVSSIVQKYDILFAFC
jgi:hypothetical protein